MWPHAGVVKFTPASGGPVRRVSAEANGRFRITLPAGRYQVTGSPREKKFWCSGGEIDVKSGKRERVTVTCPIP